MTFVLSEVELAALKLWRQAKANHKDTFAVRFEATGIGVRIIVINQRTKKEKDITDYGSW